MRGEMDKVGCESWALDEPGAKKYALVAGSWVDVDRNDRGDLR